MAHLVQTAMTSWQRPIRPDGTCPLAAECALSPLTSATPCRLLRHQPSPPACQHTLLSSTSQTASPLSPPCGFNSSLFIRVSGAELPSRLPNAAAARKSGLLFVPGIKHDDHLLKVKFIICHVLSFNFRFM